MTSGPTPPDPRPVGSSFPRERRLTDKPQFDAAHRAGIRASDPLFMVIARPNGLGHPRLGMAVGVKAAGNAVNRNRVKRALREAFRARQESLPAVDLVVNARPAARHATNAQIAASVTALWARIGERCARS